jgi:hypothetical protein
MTPPELSPERDGLLATTSNLLLGVWEELSPRTGTNEDQDPQRWIHQMCWGGHGLMEEGRVRRKWARAQLWNTSNPGAEQGQTLQDSKHKFQQFRYSKHKVTHCKQQAQFLVVGGTGTRVRAVKCLTTVTGCWRFGSNERILEAATEEEAFRVLNMHPLDIQ